MRSNKHKYFKIKAEEDLLSSDETIIDDFKKKYFGDPTVSYNNSYLSRFNQFRKKLKEWMLGKSTFKKGSKKFVVNLPEALGMSAKQKPFQFKIEEPDLINASIDPKRKDTVNLYFDIGNCSNFFEAIYSYKKKFGVEPHQTKKTKSGSIETTEKINVFNIPFSHSLGAGKGRANAQAKMLYGKDRQEIKLEENSTIFFYDTQDGWLQGEWVVEVPIEEFQDLKTATKSSRKIDESEAGTKTLTAVAHNLFNLGRVSFKKKLSQPKDKGDDYEGILGKFFKVDGFPLFVKYVDRVADFENEDFKFHEEKIKSRVKDFDDEGNVKLKAMPKHSMAGQVILTDFDNHRVYYTTNKGVMKTFSLVGWQTLNTRDFVEALGQRSMTGDDIILEAGLSRTNPELYNEIKSRVSPTSSYLFKDFANDSNFQSIIDKLIANLSNDNVDDRGRTNLDRQIISNGIENTYRMFGYYLIAKKFSGDFKKLKEEVEKKIENNRKKRGKEDIDNLIDYPLFSKSFKLKPHQALALSQLSNNNEAVMDLDPGAGKCIVGSSLIGVKGKGLVPIENLFNGYDISEAETAIPVENLNLVSRQDYNKVGYLFYDGERQCKKVSTCLGFSIEGTLEHPILTADITTGKLIHKKIKDLKEGDIVPIQYGQDNWGTEIPELESFSTWDLYDISSFGGQIPECILQAPKEYVKSFIRFLFTEADSTNIDGKYRINYYSVSEKLIDQLQIVLLNFGIVCKKQEREKKAKTYFITIQGHDNLKKFQEEIGFFSTCKNVELEKYLNSCEFDNGFSEPKSFARTYLKQIESYYGYEEHISGDGTSTAVLEKPRVSTQPVFDIEPRFKSDKLGFVYTAITNIKDTGIQKVYDVNIPESHEFFANGFISHNTVLYLLDYIEKVVKGKASRGAIILPGHTIGEQHKKLLGYTLDLASKKPELPKINVYPITSDVDNEAKGQDKLLNSLDVMKKQILKLPPNSIILVSSSWLSREANVMSNGKINGIRTYKKDFKRATWLTEECKVDAVYIDEVHDTRNSDSNLHQACKQLVQGDNIKVKRIGTGTLMPTNPGDIVGPMSILDSGIFKTKEYFANHYGRSVRQSVDKKTGKSKISIRQLKEESYKQVRETLKDNGGLSYRNSHWRHLVLPQGKKNHVLYAHLSPELKAIYDAILDELLSEILKEEGEFKGESDSFNLGTNSLTKFKKIEQFLNNPIYMKKEVEEMQKNGVLLNLPPIDWSEDNPRLFTPKIKVIDEIIENNFNKININNFDKEPNQKIIIMCQYKSVARHISNISRFKDYMLYYDAGVKEVLSEFKNNNKKRVLVGVEHSMTTGLDIFNASSIIMTGMSWSIGDEEQKIGRSFRIGQKFKVDIYYILTDGTAEVTKFSRLVSSKHSISKITSSGIGGVLNDEDFEPIVMNTFTLSSLNRREHLEPYIDMDNALDKLEDQEALRLHENYEEMLGKDNLLVEGKTSGKQIAGGKRVNNLPVTKQLAVALSKDEEKTYDTVIPIKLRSKKEKKSHREEVKRLREAEREEKRAQKEKKRLDKQKEVALKKKEKKKATRIKKKLKKIKKLIKKSKKVQLRKGKETKEDKLKKKIKAVKIEIRAIEGKRGMRKKTEAMELKLKKYSSALRKLKYEQKKERVVPEVDDLPEKSPKISGLQKKMEKKEEKLKKLRRQLKKAKLGKNKVEIRKFRKEIFGIKDELSDLHDEAQDAKKELKSKPSKKLKEKVTKEKPEIKEELSLSFNLSFDGDEDTLFLELKDDSAEFKKIKKLLSPYKFKIAKKEIYYSMPLNNYAQAMDVLKKIKAQGLRVRELDEIKDRLDDKKLYKLKACAEIETEINAARPPGRIRLYINIQNGVPHLIFYKKETDSNHLAKMRKIVSRGYRFEKVVPSHRWVTPTKSKLKKLLLDIENLGVVIKDKNKMLIGLKRDQKWSIK